MYLIDFAKHLNGHFTKHFSTYTPSQSITAAEAFAKFAQLFQRLSKRFVCTYAWTATTSNWSWKYFLRAQVHVQKTRNNFQLSSLSREHAALKLLRWVAHLYYFDS